MSDPRIVAVAPARMASSRFPGKPLASILELPMIEHVRRRAELSAVADATYVATCDTEIMDAVTAAGGRAVMTADTHERCTDRVEEAMRSIEGDIVVVVQGDEPLLDPDAIERIVQPLLDDDTVLCTNLLSPIEREEDFADTNIVKAACNQAGDVIFFSRAPIPFFREDADPPIYRQTGIMAFRADFLRKYTELPETPFERTESVDMFRVLEHGYRIVGVPVDYGTIGVDHDYDIPAVERLLQTDPRQSQLYQATLRD
jgi:3-deoxy-manno-octulosonate cytidylyltransferase (CMP-KDO synthetase)